MQEKYEQAIKETFGYLNNYIQEGCPVSTLTMSLKKQRNKDRVFIIETEMELRGFPIYCTYNHDQSVICVYPMQHNLPIHIWRG
jgi:hypothetical protein